MIAFQAAMMAGGLAALYFGAEWLVRGSARLARSYGVSTLVVGLTVVSFGSSAPELLVGVVASLQGESDVVLGNVVGSNILNIALILGIAALLRPMKVELRLLSREIPFMVGVSLLLAAFALNGVVSRLDALMLFLGFIAYLWAMTRAAAGESPLVATEFEEFQAVTSLSPTPDRHWRDALLMLGGILALVVGAQLLVQSAVFFAHLFNVSNVLIGLTIVALGTSLPELATSVVAALRSEANIALGNGIGSNIFNILCILGVSGLIRPIQVAPELMEFEIPAMVGVAIVLLPLAWHRQRLSRLSGVLLLLMYVAFTWVLIDRAMH
ncbi:MAG: calcium/sodium antiporter [Gemmatimonadota bacterium]|jgi:cation:H+ antiporter